jgi:membrane associated rhomboid family serine protease
VLIGGTFCVFVAQSFGQWRGWFLILASGVLGNLITCAVHFPQPFRSIGASTATFGALGLLVGMGMVLAWHSRSYRMLKPVIAPIAVGLVLLGWFGAGGVDTDVLGHLFGWLSGIFLGTLAAWKMKAGEGRDDLDMPRVGA